MRDFLLDENGDLAFENGDIKTGESDQQHQRLLLLFEKGSLKEFPATGVGVYSYLESESPSELLREVRSQYLADGMNVRNVAFEDGKLKVDANY